VEQPKSPPYKIETVYKVEIAFDADDWESVCDRVLKFGDKLDACDVFTGGPACFPYVTAWHRSTGPLSRFADKVVRYVGNRKGGRILE
jgi:hypothetical protein